MKTFATLIYRLDSTNKTLLKVEAVRQFLEEAEEMDKRWLLALFTGRRPKRQVSTKLLREWATERAAVPEWLFLESYAAVGDLAETIALILPEPEQAERQEKSLAEWMKEIQQLSTASDSDKKAFVLDAWAQLSLQERFIFNKLLGGSFRIGLSAKGMVNAISAHYQLQAAAVSHAILGNWEIEHTPFEALVRGEYTEDSLSRPYPFCLAYPVEGDVEDLGDLADWQVEYKWDGIRGQLIRRGGVCFIWSRGEEMVNVQFPDLIAVVQEDGPAPQRQALRDFVIDGEILVYKDGRVLPFAELQRRLNRKTVSKKMLQDVPVALFAYDLLELDGEDLRQYPLSRRRELLEQLIMSDSSIGSRILLSEIVDAKNWAELRAIWQDARKNQSEGMMLKAKDSTYHVGRKKGDWWKWKVAPMTLDAVLIYAQKGSGRRSGYYTDYTFAVRRGDELVVIAKAYSGLTNVEIQEVSKFVNKYGLERFGPVRTVPPELVFEIAFEGISRSNRHKSGVALRFPRILRWRRDKTVADIDRIEDIMRLIPEQGDS